MLRILITYICLTNNTRMHMYPNTALYISWKSPVTEMNISNIEQIIIPVCTIKCIKWAEKIYLAHPPELHYNQGEKLHMNCAHLKRKDL